MTRIGVLRMEKPLFYNPQMVQFPSGYVGDYFFADFCRGWIRSYALPGTCTTSKGVRARSTESTTPATSGGVLRETMLSLVRDKLAPWTTGM